MAAVSDNDYKIAFRRFQEEFLSESCGDSIVSRENIFRIFYTQWPNYIDPIILLIRFYRMNKLQEKATQWIKKLDNRTIEGEFFEERLCKNEFLFEKIFDEHIYKKNVIEGARFAIKYLNMKDSCNIPFIYTNLHFFSHKIPGNTEWLNFGTESIDGAETASSASFYPPENILCVRYVNYMYDELIGKISSIPENTYVSKNLIYWLGANHSEFAEEKFKISTKATRCFGLEDVRLIQNPQGQCEFWATQQQWSGDGINRIIRGVLMFDFKMGYSPIFTNPQIVEPPDKAEGCCEKNWIPFYWHESLHIIYRWWPFQVGHLTPENALIISYCQENLPEIFRHMRGSSCLIKYNGPDKYCCVTHLSLDPPDGKGLRKYFHFLVFFTLKDEKLVVTHFTEPFYFSEKNDLIHSIQYCIGFNIRPGGLGLIAQFWYSSMDNSSGFVECPMSFFEAIKHSVAQ